MKNLNELSKRIDELKTLKVSMRFTQLDTIKQTLTAMLGELDEMPKRGLIPQLSRDIQKLIDKINGEKT